uniref:hypothetical protein n=1 Tax=Cupriavidus taiwanensis TaxID=164546 RepID=UPI0018DCCBE9|nr:hypothetical protein [Cupriavidus taiwanensis]
MRHRLHHGRGGAVILHGRDRIDRAPKQLTEAPALTRVRKLEFAAAQADAVVLAQQRARGRIGLEHHALVVQQHHVDQHAVHRILVKTALGFGHVDAGIQVDRALDMRQPRQADGLVLLREVVRVMAPAQAEAAHHAVGALDIRAEHIAHIQVLEQFLVDGAAAPCLGADELVHGGHHARREVDKRVQRVVVAVVRDALSPVGFPRRHVEHRAGAVERGRAQDQGCRAGVEQDTHGLERAGPGRFLERPAIDGVEQFAILCNGKARQCID